jgi:hypothetical protein
LQGLSNVILTPHIGGSTEEAQERIGGEVSRKLVEYSDVGSTMGAVNFPQVQLPERPNGTRFIHVHENRPGMLIQLNEIFSSRRLNIVAEFLQTYGDTGYVVVEAEGISSRRHSSGIAPDSWNDTHAAALLTLEARFGNKTGAVLVASFLVQIRRRVGNSKGFRGQMPPAVC